jgi:phage-related baseplate assembly protein
LNSRACLCAALVRLYGMAISSDLFDGVDLSRLPAPTVVEALDFESIRESALADLVAFYPQFSALTAADPAIKVTEYFCYRELLIRQRVNEASLANMLAFAIGSDLDQIGARKNLERFIIDPGNPALGIDPLLESDAEFRARIQTAPETYSVAGPIAAYVQLARNASSDVRYASAFSPAPCEMNVYIQSRFGNGTASPALIATVKAYLSDEDRRPAGDRLNVASATIKPFAIQATIRTFSGPAPEVVLATAQSRLDLWLRENERLGRDITTDGIIAALRVDGVQKVNLISPLADVICSVSEAGHCTGINLTHLGEGE